jgi:hypothetical protein|tara:strand:+ start:49 stop:429 length:381 start_codon:yes stop_codon:yes gene_type:complete
MKKVFYIFFISIFLLTSCSDSKLSTLEQKYVDELHQWIQSGGNKNTVRSLVQANCSKLTMVMATKKENASFLDKSNIDEYDFRAGFCMSAVIENVWPNQPGFTKKFRKEVCREKIPFIKTVCKEFI